MGVFLNIDKQLSTQFPHYLLLLNNTIITPLMASRIIISYDYYVVYSKQLSMSQKGEYCYT